MEFAECVVSFHSFEWPLADRPRRNIRSKLISIREIMCTPTTYLFRLSLLIFAGAYTLDHADVSVVLESFDFGGQCLIFSFKYAWWL